MSEKSRDRLRSIGWVILIIGTMIGLWQSWRTSVEMRADAVRAQSDADFREAAVEQKESAFREAIESDRVARVMVDENGLITGFSAGAERLANVPLSEAIGHSLEELGLIDGGAAAELESPPTGKTLKVTLPLNRHGKTPVDVEARSTGIGEGQGAIISFDRTKSVVELHAAAE